MKLASYYNVEKTIPFDSSTRISTLLGDILPESFIEKLTSNPYYVYGHEVIPNELEELEYVDKYDGSFFIDIISEHVTKQDLVDVAYQTTKSGVVLIKARGALWSIMIDDCPINGTFLTEKGIVVISYEDSREYSGPKILKIKPTVEFQGKLREFYGEKVMVFLDENMRGRAFLAGSAVLKALYPNLEVKDPTDVDIFLTNCPRSVTSVFKPFVRAVIGDEADRQFEEFVPKTCTILHQDFEDGSRHTYTVEEDGTLIPETANVTTTMKLEDTHGDEEKPVMVKRIVHDDEKPDFTFSRTASTLVINRKGSRAVELVALKFGTVQDFFSNSKFDAHQVLYNGEYIFFTEWFKEAVETKTCTKYCEEVSKRRIKKLEEQGWNVPDTICKPYACMWKGNLTEPENSFNNWIEAIHYITHCKIIDNDYVGYTPKPLPGMPLDSDYRPVEIQDFESETIRHYKQRSRRAVAATTSGIYRITSSCGINSHIEPSKYSRLEYVINWRTGENLGTTTCTDECKGKKRCKCVAAYFGPL